MVDSSRRPPAAPETAWGACRAVLQAGAGSAFVLEGRPVVGALLVALAVATATYEAVQWWRWSPRRPAARRATSAGRDGGSAAPRVRVRRGTPARRGAARG